MYQQQQRSICEYKEEQMINIKQVTSLAQSSFFTQSINPEQQFGNEANEPFQKLNQNESEKACIQFLQKFSPASILNIQAIDQKNLDSMLKLLDKYHVPFEPVKSDITSQNQDKKDENENKKKNLYKKFSKEEDVLLKNIVGIFGPKNWRLISSMIPNKTPRQCRDRYTNYLAPGFIHSNWTNEEDRLLAQKYIELGPQWSKIQQYFPFRTANSIKNRYKYTVCRYKNLFGLNKQTEKLAQNNLSNADAVEQKNDNILGEFDDGMNSDIFDFGFQDCFFENFEYNNPNDYNLNY